MDNQEIWDENWSRISEYVTNSAGNRWAFYLIRKILRGVELDNDSCVVDIGCGVNFQ